MAEDLERKRARDLARYRAKREAGTWQHSQAVTPEQLAKKQARQERHLQWREVQRAFERVLRLPPPVYDEALRRVKEKT